MVWLIFGCGAAPPPPSVPVALEAQVGPRSEGRPLPGFEGVVVDTETSFAHDRGDETRVLAVRLDGDVVPETDLLERWVSRRGGWGEGEDRDAVVASTALRFVTAMLTVREETFLTEATSHQLDRTLSGGAFDFHGPRAEFVTVGDRRWVVVTGYTFDSISQRGKHFTRHAHAFDVRDGARAPRGTKGLPERVGFSEMEPPRSRVPAGR